MQQKLVIYASPIPATYIVGPAISRFVSQFPNCQIILKTNDSSEFFETATDLEFHLGVFDISGFKNSRFFDCECLLKSGASLCCRKDHPLFEKQTVTIEDIIRYPFATPAVLPNYVVHELNRILGFPIEDGHCQVNLLYDSLVTVRHAIIGSNLIAIAPYLALTHSLSSELKKLDVQDWPLMEAEFGIITKRAQSLPQFANDFIEILFDTAESIQSNQRSLAI